MVKPDKKSGDRFVEFAQAAEAAFAQCGHDPALNHLNGIFHLGFVPWFSGARRQDGHAIMGRHLAVGRVEIGLVTAGFGDSRPTVTFTAPATGPSATLGAAAPTGANGQTSVTATANSVGGTYQVTATVGGTSISAVFTLTNLTVANTLTLGPATGTSLVNTAYTETGTYTNSSNSPVSGATVNFSVLNGPNAGKKGSGVGEILTGRALLTEYFSSVAA